MLYSNVAEQEQQGAHHIGAAGAATRCGSGSDGSDVKTHTILFLIKKIIVKMFFLLFLLNIAPDLDPDTLLIPDPIRIHNPVSIE
jgi:hypothetical protein